jgi:hypothetical protein
MDQQQQNKGDLPNKVDKGLQGQGERDQQTVNLPKGGTGTEKGGDKKPK